MSRVHYAECRVEVAGFEEQDAFDCDDAEVWIEADSILISYFDDEGIVVLEGHPDDSSGWVLSARSRPRRAFLKPIADSPGGYVGEINEQGEVAEWRLHLGDPDST